MCGGGVVQSRCGLVIGNRLISISSPRMPLSHKIWFHRCPTFATQSPISSTNAPQVVAYTVTESRLSSYFFRPRDFPELEGTVLSDNIGLPVASLRDLAISKLTEIQNRAGKATIATCTQRCAKLETSNNACFGVGFRRVIFSDATLASVLLVRHRIKRGLIA